MEFSSSSVMAYILYKGQLVDHPINKTQAQKLLYCCYGAVLAEFDERLTDERPKAWPYGPIFPRAVNDVSKKRLNVGMAKKFIEACPPAVLNLIDRTIEKFWGYSAPALSAWSHRKGSPWDKAAPLEALDDREIQRYFTQIVPLVKGEAQ